MKYLTTFLRGGLFAALMLFVTGITAQAQTTTAPATLPNPYTTTAPGVVGQGGIIPLGSPNGMMQNQAMPSAAMSQGQQQGMFYPDPKEYVLSAGDLINVRLFSSADYYSTGRISKDGTIQLPLIGSTKLAGMTIVDAELMVANKLRTAEFYQKPEIIITLAEPVVTQTVTFAGELHGMIPVSGKQRSLVEVIASAGGFPPTASHVVSIIRPGVDQPITVDLGHTPEEMARADIEVKAHDTIFIERSGVVYIIGAFRSTGAIPIANGTMTLMQIAALAGGPLFTGKYDDMRIIRTTGTQRSVVTIDVKKVLYGKAPDPIMQAGDIIFLPNSAWKTAISAGGIGVLFSVVSLLVFASR